MIKKIILCLIIFIVAVSVDARPRHGGRRDSGRIHHRHHRRKMSDLEKASVIVDMTVGTLATLNAISNSNNCRTGYIEPRSEYTNGNVYIPPPSYIVPPSPPAQPKVVKETIVKIRGKRTVVTEEEYEKVIITRTYD